MPVFIQYAHMTYSPTGSKELSWNSVHTSCSDIFSNQRNSLTSENSSSNFIRLVCFQRYISIKQFQLTSITLLGTVPRQVISVMGSPAPFNHWVLCDSRFGVSPFLTFPSTGNFSVDSAEAVRVQRERAPCQWDDSHGASGGEWRHIYKLTPYTIVITSGCSPLFFFVSEVVVVLLTFSGRLNLSAYPYVDDCLGAQRNLKSDCLRVPEHCYYVCVNLDGI